MQYPFAVSGLVPEAVMGVPYVPLMRRGRSLRMADVVLPVVVHVSTRGLLLLSAYQRATLHTVL